MLLGSQGSLDTLHAAIESTACPSMANNLGWVNSSKLRDPSGSHPVRQHGQIGQ
jgi:hypothetical protein